MNPMPAVPLIGVCGPIGSGKSTVAPVLASTLGFHPWLERVDANPFFGRYMADRPSWGMRSQVAFMIGALEDAAAARRKPPGGVIERPAQEMFGVFVRFLHEQGVLDPDEVRTLRRLLKLGEQLAGVPDVLVVLHADPHVVLERIRDRGRSGEDAYTLDDMRHLETTYREWAEGWCDSPVVEIDTTELDLRMDSDVRHLARQINAVLEPTR
jgi:deoxyadenosine/deoxycytidine kinase